MHFLYLLSHAQFNFLFTAPTSHKAPVPFVGNATHRPEAWVSYFHSIFISCETFRIKEWLFAQGLILV